MVVHPVCRGFGAAERAEGEFEDSDARDQIVGAARGFVAGGTQALGRRGVENGRDEKGEGQASNDEACPSPFEL